MRVGDDWPLKILFQRIIFNATFLFGL